MRTVAIIQARMESTRLPGKVLADVEGSPMLRRVVDRALCASALEGVVVATSTQSADDEIARFCERAGFGLFRGSCDDVLDRYHSAARTANADVVVRLTADCPLLDPAVIDRVVGEFHDGGFDYVSNVLTPTYPDGLDVEVFSVECLDSAWRDAGLSSEREHVTAYIVKHLELFRLGCVRNDVDLSQLRWTVDTPADLEFVRAVYRACGPEPFGVSEVLALLNDRPELCEINAGIARNEGYERSLREDCTTERSVVS